MSRENAQAALAQSVERRLGKAEVGGLVSASRLQDLFKKQSCISGWKVQCLLFFHLSVCGKCDKLKDMNQNCPQDND